MHRWVEHQYLPFRSRLSVTPEVSLIYAGPVVERGPHPEYATLFVGLKDDLGPQLAIVATATEGVSFNMRELAKRLTRVVRR